MEAADFAPLRAYLNRIKEVAQEDSYSVVSLGVTPAVEKAILELDRLATKNCSNCGYPGISDARGNQLKKGRSIDSSTCLVRLSGCNGWCIGMLVVGEWFD